MFKYLKNWLGWSAWGFLAYMAIGMLPKEGMLTLLFLIIPLVFGMAGFALDQGWLWLRTKLSDRSDTGA